jgi:WS/DGAT/MGAT family acyltransferase
MLGSLTKVAGSVLGLAPSTVKLARAALFEQQLTLPFAAPHTMFNVRIGGARRCAAQSWSMDRVKAVKQATGVSMNDAVLAMCAGALRYYLIEQDALPDAPLIAMVPVSLRSKEDADKGGNQVGSILCNLATDLEDPAQRLQVISESMRGNKKVLADLPPLQVLALSALNMAPLALAGIPGFLSAVPPPFNIVI